jgi:hypothetical protein
MQLKPWAKFGLLAVCVGMGCTTQRHVSSKSEDFVGDYVYRCADKGALHDPDRLTLRADGKYILIQMPTGHPGLRKEGTWRLLTDPAPEILLDHAGYPVEIEGNEVRLLINDDLGESYQKTK